MIVSHRHKFIFIKTRKTAGTSIEASLSRYCGPQDVVTPVSLEDEWFRGQFGLGPQNFRTDVVGEDAPLEQQWLKRQLLKCVSKLELWREDTVPYRVKKKVVAPRGPKDTRERGFYNHMPLSEVMNLVDEPVYKSYFKFTFERNPYDKVTSDYWYRASNRTIDEFLKDGPLPTDFSKYAIDNRIAVDFVGRFENLQSDLHYAMRQVGIDFDGWLPRAKSGRRKSTLKATDLNEAQLQIIKSAFRREIEEFGYTPPSLK